MAHVVLVEQRRITDATIQWCLNTSASAEVNRSNHNAMGQDSPKHGTNFGVFYLDGEPMLLELVRTDF